MNRFVTDSSVTMAWCFEDEASAYADAILDRLVVEEAVVPALWPLEVANVLLVGERRARLTAADSARFLALLASLPITTDDETPQRALREILSLGREQRLSAYDAAYLELAMRLGIPLATQDDRLREAANHLGVAVIDVP